MDMSDEDPPAASLHGRSSPEASEEPTVQPRYKSWRKKYRKMKARFDDTLRENVAGYKTEQKLESIARRLQEQNDQLLDLLLDFNGSLQLPHALRFNIATAPPSRDDPTAAARALDVANQRLLEVHRAIEAHSFNPANLRAVREEIEERVANETTTRLIDLEAQCAPPLLHQLEALPVLPSKVDGQLGYLTSAHEAEYLMRTDAELGDHLSKAHLRSLTHDNNKDTDRDMELRNPQSVHNWLKANKISVEADDRSEAGTPVAGALGKKGKSLARKVGDRALERARERDGRSPPTKDTDMDEDTGLVEDANGKKRKGRDPDEAYRPKGSSRTKAKRKRDEGEGGAGRKKPKTSTGPGEDGDG